MTCSCDAMLDENACGWFMRLSACLTPWVLHPPQLVRGRRSGHHAGGAPRGRQTSRISDPTTEATVRPALPPHIPHQITHSSSPTGARGRAHGASSSTPWTNRGSSRPPVPPRSKDKARIPPPSSEEGPGSLDFLSPSIHGWTKDSGASRAPSGT